MLNKAYGAPVAFCAGRCSHGRRRRKPLAGCSDFLRGHLKTSKDAPKTSKTHHRISASFWNCRYFEGTAAQNETESVSFFGLYLCCRRKMCQFQWFYVFFFGFWVTSSRQEGQEPKWQWEYAPGIGRGMVSTLHALQVRSDGCDGDFFWRSKNRKRYVELLELRWT